MQCSNSVRLDSLREPRHQLDFSSPKVQTHEKQSFIFIFNDFVLDYVDTDMSRHKGHFTIEQVKLNYSYYSLLLRQYFMFRFLEEVLLLFLGWHCCHPIRRKELMFGMIKKLLIRLMDLLQLSTKHS
jgi:hypothetical protein